MEHDAETLLHLPGLLGELVRRGYPEAALILAGEWGGQKRYIPNKPGNLLAELIGLEAAAVAAALFGGRDHDIPTGNGLNDLKSRILAHPGTTRETAKAVGCTERYVRMVRRGSYGQKPPSRKQLILWQSGTPSEIAAKLGCSVTYVAEVLAESRRGTKIADKAVRRRASRAAERHPLPPKESL